MPVFASREAGGDLAPALVGLPVRLAPGRAVSGLPLLYPSTLGGQRQLWAAVRRAAGSPQTVESQQGWTRVRVEGVPGPGDHASLVMRDDDWLLLRAALDDRLHDPTAPQDAPVEQVLAHHLARLDGLDGTPGEGWWGRLALEVVSLRVPPRIADTVSLRWTACWGGPASAPDPTAGPWDRATARPSRTSGSSGSPSGAGSSGCALCPTGSASRRPTTSGSRWGPCWRGR